MSGAAPRAGRNAGAPFLVAYLLIGLAFQLLYWGLPWPFAIGTWLHVLLWPLYVLLGLIRHLFVAFAFVAILVFVAAWLVARWRSDR